MFRPRGRRRKGKPRRVEELRVSLGKFANFPSLVHGLVKISHENTTAKIQRAIIQAFYGLNEYREAYSLSVSGHVGIYEGWLTFEVGAANGLFFDYLDEEAVGKLYSPLESGKEYSILDFLVIITYHYSREGKRVPLNFDHHILRFLFHDGEVEVSLFHSKGTRRMPLDELLSTVISRISLEAKRSGLKPITIEKSRTL